MIGTTLYSESCVNFYDEIQQSGALFTFTSKTGDQEQSSAIHYSERVEMQAGVYKFKDTEAMQALCSMTFGPNKQTSVCHTGDQLGQFPFYQLETEEVRKIPIQDSGYNFQIVDNKPYTLNVEAEHVDVETCNVNTLVFIEFKLILSGNVILEHSLTELTHGSYQAYNQWGFSGQVV